MDALEVVKSSALFDALTTDAARRGAALKIMNACSSDFAATMKKSKEPTSHTKKKEKGIDDLTYLPVSIYIAHALALCFSIFTGALLLGSMSSFSHKISAAELQVQSLSTTLDATTGLVANSGAYTGLLNQRAAADAQSIDDLEAALRRVPGATNTTYPGAEQISGLRATNLLLVGIASQLSAVAVAAGPGTPAFVGAEAGAVWLGSLSWLLDQVQTHFRAPPWCCQSCVLFSIAVSMFLAKEGVLAYRDTQRTTRQGTASSSKAVAGSRISSSGGAGSRGIPALAKVIGRGQQQEMKPATRSKQNGDCNGGVESDGAQPQQPPQAACTLSKANKFIGLQIGSSIFGSMLVGFASFPIFFFCLWTESYKFIFRFNDFSVPVGLILTLVQLFLENYIGDRRMSDGFWVKRRETWVLYAGMVVCLNMITGIFFALKRFVLLSVGSIAAVSRLDYTTFPAAFVASDTGYCSYMALQGLSHRNSAAAIFVGVLTGDGDGERPDGWLTSDSDGASEMHELPSARRARQRNRNRWHLAYSKSTAARSVFLLVLYCSLIYSPSSFSALLNNPSLIELRRHVNASNAGSSGEAANPLHANSGVEDEAGGGGFINPGVTVSALDEAAGTAVAYATHT